MEYLEPKKSWGFMGSYKQMVLLPPYPLLASHGSLIGIPEDSYDLNIFCRIVKL